MNDKESGNNKSPLEDVVRGEYFLKANTREYSQKEIDSVFEKLQELGVELKHKYITGTYHIRIADLEREGDILKELNRLIKEKYISSIEPVHKVSKD